MVTSYPLKYKLEKYTRIVSIFMDKSIRMKRDKISSVKEKQTYSKISDHSFMQTGTLSNVYKRPIGPIKQILLA